MTGDRFTRLELVLPTGAEFLSMFLPGDATGSFVFRPPPGRDLPPEATPGTLVSVSIAFADREASVHLHAWVLDRVDGARVAAEAMAARGNGRDAPAEAPAPMLRLEFLPEEKHRQDLVLACAHGESVPYQRRRRDRVQCELPVRMRSADGVKTAGTAICISEDGMHVALADLPAAESVVEIVITFPEAPKRMTMSGRVTGLVPGGPQQGAGIEFLFRSAHHRAELAKQVAKLRALKTL